MSWKKAKIAKPAVTLNKKRPVPTNAENKDETKPKHKKRKADVADFFRHAVMFYFDITSDLFHLVSLFVRQLPKANEATTLGRQSQGYTE